METLLTRIRILVLGLFTIALGIYILNFIGMRFFFVVPSLYYTILAISALLYILGIIGIYYGYRYIQIHVRRIR